MTPFAKKVIETDWNMMYGLLEEHFYPRRWMKSDTFPQWLQKYTKIDQKKLYNMIEITEEEYDTWYVYFLEYYIGSDTIFYKSNTEKEAKKLLNKLKRFFGLPKYDGDHRWGNILKKLFFDYQLNN